MTEQFLNVFEVCIQIDSGGAVITIHTHENDDDKIFELAMAELISQCHAAKLGYINRIG
jgi:hypothetical protein